MEWAVLDWNEPALRFYKSLDARQMNEWIIHRLTPREIEKLRGRRNGDTPHLPSESGSVPLDGTLSVAVEREALAAVGELGSGRRDLVHAHAFGQ